MRMLSHSKGSFMFFVKQVVLTTHHYYYGTRLLHNTGCNEVVTYLFVSTETHLFLNTNSVTTYQPTLPVLLCTNVSPLVTWVTV